MGASLQTPGARVPVGRSLLPADLGSTGRTVKGRGIFEVKIRPYSKVLRVFHRDGAENSVLCKYLFN